MCHSPHTARPTFLIWTRVLEPVALICDKNFLKKNNFPPIFWVNLGLKIIVLGGGVQNAVFLWAAPSFLQVDPGSAAQLGDVGEKKGGWTPRGWVLFGFLLLFPQHFSGNSISTGLYNGFLMSSLGPLPDIFGPADPSIQDPQKWKTDFAMCLSVPNPGNIKKHGAAVVESKEGMFPTCLFQSFKSQRKKGYLVVPKAGHVLQHHWGTY